MTGEHGRNRRIDFNRRTFLRGVTATGITLSGVSASAGSTYADSGHLNTVDEGTLNLSGLSWEDPTVTYEVRMNNGITQDMEDGVREAIDKWQHLVHEHSNTGLTRFEQADSGTSADITIRVRRGGGQIAGQELTRNSDRDGAANESIVHISGSSFGDFDDAYARTLSVTLHELGHSFQLGHYSGADADKEVMSTSVQDPPVTDLSTCDLSAFNTAHDDLPNPPEETDVSCGN